MLRWCLLLSTTVSALDDVHVVVAGDRVQSLGVVACARSLFATTAQPERIVLHVIVDPGSAADIRFALSCALGKRRFELHAFELDTYTRHANGTSRLHIRIPMKKHKVNLASELNFARFYLTDMLNADKVVYLDADTIVVGDVAQLYDSTLVSSGFPFAAVSRKHKKICGAFLNCDNTEVAAVLERNGVTEDQLDAFNAGVMVLDLKTWKRVDFTKQVEYWIRWNEQIPLYDLASNPPLVLAARGRFEHLADEWNCQRLMPCWSNGTARVLHWNGAVKPWFNTSHEDTTLWLPHLPPPSSKCLAKLPKLGHGAPSDAAPSKRQIPLETRTEAMKLWLHDSLGATWRDLELAQKAADLVRAVDEAPPFSTDEADAKLIAEMEASIAKYPPLGAKTLIEHMLQFAVGHAAPFWCEFVIVAIINGRLYADVGDFASTTAKCGIAPPDPVVHFLHYLAVLLEEDSAAAFEDAVFLVTTNAAPAFTKIPKGLPVFVYSKKGLQPGIIVPGPAYVASHELVHATSPMPPTTHHGVSLMARLASAGSSDWHRRFEALRGQDDDAWDSRAPRALWRGRMTARYYTCLDDATWARLELLALAHDFPDLIDARLTTNKEVRRSSLASFIALLRSGTRRPGILRLAGSTPAGPLDAAHPHAQRRRRHAQARAGFEAQGVPR